MRLARSLTHASGRLLVAGANALAPAALATVLKSAPFVLLSHGTTPAADPVLNYANAAAIALFALNDNDIGNMPTRLTAAPAAQAARAKLLKDVTTNGWSDAYSGPRVARNGRTFVIKNATVWNVLALEDGGTGEACGQAAMFSEWDANPNDVAVTPGPVIAHVQVRCLPQHIALFKVLTQDNAQRSTTEELGCLRFDVLQSATDPASFTLVEHFVDAYAAAAHKQTVHYLRWRDAVAPLMAEPRRAAAFNSIFAGPEARQR